MNYADIKEFDINNGEGIRVSLWVTGCPIKCKGCHNEVLWNKDKGSEFTEETLENILELLEKDMSKDFSVLGGEPLAPYNVDEVTRVCKKVKEVYPEKTIWLWTGNTFETVKDLEVMSYIDVVIDGKFNEELKDDNLMWRGSSNQRIIRLKEGEPI